VDAELEPPQPEPVAAAIAEVLSAENRPDPWWQAGIEESVRE
jgi:hypothetical protein